MDCFALWIRSLPRMLDPRSILITYIASSTVSGFLLEILPIYQNVTFLPIPFFCTDMLLSRWMIPNIRMCLGVLRECTYVSLRECLQTVFVLRCLPATIILYYDAARIEHISFAALYTPYNPTSRTTVLRNKQHPREREEESISLNVLLLHLLSGAHVFSRSSYT